MIGLIPLHPPEGNTCTPAQTASGKSPYLMFTNRHEIRRIDLMKRDYTLVAPTLKNAVALDVDVSTNRMYWTDLFHRKIYSAFINKASNSSQHSTVIGSTLQSPQGLALDWVHKNLYWTDSGHKSISVASADGKKSRVLINTEPSEPCAIAVDPAQGFMYWSDWGVQAKIERAGMNGVDRQVLVSERIEWPNGITLDLPNRRLYWVDSKLHLISSVDLNGANRRVLLSSPQQLGHPFALAVFEVTHRGQGGCTAASESLAVRAARGTLLAKPAELSVAFLKNKHSMFTAGLVRRAVVALSAPNSCTLGGVVNGGCQYLCLKAPQITDNSPKYTCACPNGHQLGADMRHCVAAKPKDSVTGTTVAMDVTRATASTTKAQTNPLPESPAGHGPYLLGSNMTVAVLGIVIPIGRYPSCTMPTQFPGPCF
ncbi:hypothetical protein JZ751_014331 [Albula glossodonta]|uniref:Uncharacterized protein n=1 Tax=Albula glossodonta TaxID=121402 RepID=A0A8T2NVP5_9TELE|nr:hypothetical protein JZ751_014331 [Albula glossodonta]